MPDTPYQQNAKTFKIVPWGKTIKYLNITIIAGGSSKMENPERFFKAIIFKTHVVKYLKFITLITKSNQNQGKDDYKVHPYEKKADSLLDLYSGICVPYKSHKKYYGKDFENCP